MNLHLKNVRRVWCYLYFNFFYTFCYTFIKEHLRYLIYLVVKGIKRDDIKADGLLRLHLVPFVQFKNVKNTCGRVLLLVKPVTLLKWTLLHWCFSRILYCTNNTKSHKASHVFIPTKFSLWVLININQGSFSVTISFLMIWTILTKAKKS